MTTPLELIPSAARSSVQRPKEFAYEKLVVVAHSFGAIVGRQALVDSHRLGSDWTKKVEVKLVLFAPAHKGATISRTASAILTLPGNASAVLGRCLEKLLARKSGLTSNSYLAALDVEKDCATLQVLEQQTRVALATGNADHLIAARVIFGTLEDIVEPVTFAEDPPPCILEGKSHEDVCKPNPGFMKPVELVAAAIV